MFQKVRNVRKRNTTELYKLENFFDSVCFLTLFKNINYNNIFMYRFTGIAIKFFKFQLSNTFCSEKLRTMSNKSAKVFITRPDIDQIGIELLQKE